MNDYNLTGLSDDDLNQVSGGMDCQTAEAVASVYILTGKILGSLAIPAGSMYFSGMAGGVIREVAGSHLPNRPPSWESATRHTYQGEVFVCRTNGKARAAI